MSRYPLAALLELRGALREQARRAVADALRSLSDRERERAAAQAACSALASEHADLTGHLYDPDPAGLLSIPLVVPGPGRVLCVLSGTDEIVLKFGAKAISTREQARATLLLRPIGDFEDRSKP